MKQTIDNCFNSILINHKIIYEKTPLPTLFLFRGQGGNTTALRRPCLSLSAITASLHCLPRCLRSRVTCDKTPNVVTWSEHLKICCHVINTRKRPTVKQSARKFGNLSVQTNERTWVNCKLSTAWHQNSEPGSCSAWVSYRQINCYCKKYINWSELSCWRQIF